MDNTKKIQNPYAYHTRQRYRVKKIGAAAESLNLLTPFTCYVASYLPHYVYLSLLAKGESIIDVPKPVYSVRRPTGSPRTVHEWW